jgi:serine/threonine-protein kinase
MEPPENQVPRGRSLGRYVLYDEFAIGGTATVHFGRLRGQGGFSRTVAIKRLHPQFARDPHFVRLLVEEARLAARVQHPNVVAPLDVVAVDDCELLLIMEYVHGEALSRLLGACARRGARVSPPVAVSVIAGVLYGLHAAHEAVTDAGEPLRIVHRDVSPQNILVGADGAARVLDFGVAKATSRSHATDPGALKGKLSYMAPEQLRGKEIDRRADVFAAGVVLWEMLTLRRLFRSDDEGTATSKILKGEVPAPSQFNPHVPPALDRAVAGALARNREGRFGTALEFAAALEEAVTGASGREVGQWVQLTAAESLARRAHLRASVESASSRESGAMQVLSVAAAAVPAPEDESVTVRATPSQLRNAAAGEVVTARPEMPPPAHGDTPTPLPPARAGIAVVGGPLRRLVAPPRPSAPMLPLLEPAVEGSVEDVIQDQDEGEPTPDPTETDANLPHLVAAAVQESEDEQEIERALSIFAPVDQPPPVPQALPGPEPPPAPVRRTGSFDGYRPQPSPHTTTGRLFDVLSMRSLFSVPTRVWGALGMTIFAAALALVIVLPSRSMPPTRGRGPASLPRSASRPAPAAPTERAAPEFESIPAAAPPPPPVQAAAPEPPPAPAPESEPAPAPRPRALRAEEPVVELEDEAGPAQLQASVFGKVHGAAAARRRAALRVRNRPAEAEDPGCSPPYVLDERGIRRIRPECLAVP